MSDFHTIPKLWDLWGFSTRLKQWSNHFNILFFRRVSTGFTFASFLMYSGLPSCPSQHPHFGWIWFVLIFLVYGLTFCTVRHDWSDNNCFEEFVFQLHRHLPIAHLHGYFLPLHPPERWPHDRFGVDLLNITTVPYHNYLGRTFTLFSCRLLQDCEILITMLYSDVTSLGVVQVDREPRTVIHVKRAKMFDPVGWFE